MKPIELKRALAKCQPYFIEKELLPRMYFREEMNERITDCYGNKKDVEYWIFYYTFIRKLTQTCIGVRLNYTQQYIFQRLMEIMKNNSFLIENFLDKYVDNGQTNTQKI